MRQTNSLTQNGPRLKSIFRKPRVHTTLGLILGLIVSCCAAALVSRAHNQPLTGTLRRSISQAKPQPKLTESVLLTLTPRGFDAKEITVPDVPFFLLVENRSGLAEMAVSLQRQGGSSITSARVQREDLDWAEFLSLAPGNYVISEASHPDQVCRLTVTSK